MIKSFGPEEAPQEGPPSPLMQQNPTQQPTQQQPMQQQPQSKPVSSKKIFLILLAIGAVILLTAFILGIFWNDIFK